MEAKKRNDLQWRTVKKVLRYIGRFRLWLAASLLFAFLTVVLTLLAPRLTGEAVDHMIGAGRVDFPGVHRVCRRSGVVPMAHESLQQPSCLLCGEGPQKRGVSKD